MLAATFEERAPCVTQVGSIQQSSGACVAQVGSKNPLYGLYISNNGGQSFNLVKPDSGLPAGPVTALVADPSSSTTFYAAITSPTTPTSAGVYVTTNSGSYHMWCYSEDWDL